MGISVEEAVVEDHLEEEFGDPGGQVLRRNACCAERVQVIDPGSAHEVELRTLAIDAFSWTIGTRPRACPRGSAPTAGVRRLHRVIALAAEHRFELVNQQREADSPSGRPSPIEVVGQSGENEQVALDVLGLQPDQVADGLERHAAWLG